MTAKDRLEMASRVAVDLDNTLNTGDAQWWNGDHGTMTSSTEEVRDAINELYKRGKTILIHTARPEDVRAETEAWLKKNGVYYHALVMDKLSADAYIDDKAINVHNERQALRQIAYPENFEGEPDE